MSGLHQVTVLLGLLFIAGVSGRSYPPTSNNNAIHGVPPALLFRNPWESTVNEADEFSILCRDATGTLGRCVPSIACVHDLMAMLSSKDEPTDCKMKNGETGVCCTAQQSQTVSALTFEGKPRLRLLEDRRFTGVSHKQLLETWKEAKKIVEENISAEEKILRTAAKIDKQSAAQVHQNFMIDRGQELNSMAREGRISSEANRLLHEKFSNGVLHMDEQDDGNITTLWSELESFQATSCTDAVLQSKYRTADGSCNNANQPFWGQSRTATGRLSSPTYDDGISTPRSKSVLGIPLPSARKVSSAVFINTDRLETTFSQTLVQFAQFLDHDLTRTPVPDVGSIACCRNGVVVNPPPLQSCLAISIPADDPFYSRFQQRCMEFVRSSFAPSRPGSPAYSEQMNALTAWIDVSNVYGQNVTDTLSLRERVGGRLKTTSLATGRAQLPRASTTSGGCTSGDRTVACFLAGDTRVNEQPGLALAHTIWLREHNRVAAELRTRFPTRGDEQLFQDARRFVIAEMQHIIYNEWLPLVVGPTAMSAFDLYLRNGFGKYYNPAINPVIATEFSTAAFRFGHTLVHHTGSAVPRTSNTPSETFPLRNSFNDLASFERAETVENFIRGHAVLPMQRYDYSIIDDLRNLLFNEKKSFGMDLMSLNIQRGRDHGLPTYNTVRAACGLIKAKTFNDLAQNVPSDAIQRLKSVYASVEDIDLFVGGLVETPVPNAIVGHIFSCIIGEQFRRLRHGDRHFYELGGQAGSFSPEMLTEIKTKVSFARILCDNSDIGEVQPLAFLLPSPASYWKMLGLHQSTLLAGVLFITRVSGRSYPPTSYNNAIHGVPPTLLLRNPWESTVNDADESSILCRDATGTLGRCVPSITCVHDLMAMHYSNDEPTACKMKNGETGVCCTAQRSQNPLASKFTGTPKLRLLQDSRFSGVSHKQLLETWKEAKKIVEENISAEEKILRTAAKIDEQSAAQVHQNFMIDRGQELNHMAREVLQMDEQNDGNITTLWSELESFQATSCTNAVLQSKYRTADGSCNNAYQTFWGQSKTATGRYFYPTYDDGISTPRTKSVLGGTLPSARKISSAVFINTDRMETIFSNNLVQFSQFIDHDFVKTPVPDVGSTACCQNGVILNPPPLQSCLAISIPADDPFYSKFQQQCMEFVRSSFAPSRPGSPAYTEQLNALTAWFDASNVYGQDEAETLSLRERVGGRLKTTSLATGRAQLPRAPTTSGVCTSGNKTVPCFVAGDTRVNEQPGLVLAHMVWVREHNRVAAELRTRFPTWGDEQLFQDARRFVIAEMQHIIYNEWLPPVIGPTAMSVFDLYLRNGYGKYYRRNVNPVIATEFSTAAFRFGHTLVHHTGSAVPRTSNTPSETFPLKDTFNDLASFERAETVENFIRGHTVTPMQRFDYSIVDDLRNLLFKAKKSFGLDLMALNIQRGRDHGLPTYNTVRAACGLPKAKTFDDLAPDVPYDAIQRLKSVYASVADIDLFVGGLVELPVLSGIVGQTFACIIGDQFRRLRHGDRHFYELGGQAGSFSPEMLTEIKTKVSYARILCDNSDIGEVQPLAFLLPSPIWNPKILCTSSRIPKVRLDNWT
ncbi:unnamed protein product [Notodromas monacha]|uniref:Clip domain-containing protein n=1 Tax=Notodromas monacha TaxID=399045 RepID=A0A7R9BQT3_9CRUS|nr:unnamed protein product [Notodromas monacha]CAG0918619.1 unnamed protein product [Notodromas monacha]